MVSIESLRSGNWDLFLFDEESNNLLRLVIFYSNEFVLDNKVKLVVFVTYGCCWNMRAIMQNTMRKFSMILLNGV